MKETKKTEKSIKKVKKYKIHKKVQKKNNYKLASLVPLLEEGVQREGIWDA